MDGAVCRTESRGAMHGKIIPRAMTSNWMKHTLASIDPDARTVSIDYRPVHSFTMTNEMHYIRAEGAGLLTKR